MKTLIVFFFTLLLCMSCEHDTDVHDTRKTDIRNDSLHADSAKTSPGGGVHIDIEIDTTENGDTANFEIEIG